jgi:hypothetical protein
MSAGQYKRIYNLVFPVLVLCTWVFVYGTSKEIVSSIVENAKEDYQYRLDQEPPFDQARHDDLVKQGKTKEAEEMANTGDRKAEHFIAVGNRIDYCEENLGMLSVIPTLLAYIAAYFLDWYSARFCVQYVNMVPK